jgi:hypothetical protein
VDIDLGPDLAREVDVDFGPDLAPDVDVDFGPDLAPDRDRSSDTAVLLSFPFQIHSATPPPSRTGITSSLGVARSSPIASRKFDFPEPFAPMSTLSGSRSTACASGPKERRFVSLRLLRSIAFDDQGTRAQAL